jgi:hypothetical protein
MALSWNEIKERAVKFSKEWKGTSNEEADAKPFLDAFFDVFGITRKKIGTFGLLLLSEDLLILKCG